MPAPWLEGLLTALATSTSALIVHWHPARVEWWLAQLWRWLA